MDNSAHADGQVNEWHRWPQYPIPYWPGKCEIWCNIYRSINQLAAPFQDFSIVDSRRILTLAGDFSHSKYKGRLVRGNIADKIILPNGLVLICDIFHNHGHRKYSISDYQIFKWIPQQVFDRRQLRLYWTKTPCLPCTTGHLFMKIHSGNATEVILIQSYYIFITSTS